MKLTARSLMYTLSALVFLISSATVGGFYVAQSKLHDYAESITQLNANAEAGDKDIETLKQLADTLNGSQDTISSTKAIVSESKQYVYQNQIIEDITAIAKRSGVTVTAFEFSDSKTGSESNALTPAAGVAPGATPAVPGAPDAQQPTAASAVKSVVTNITIKNPLPYSALMDFIQAIEVNRMKMQIAKVSLSGDKDGDVTSQGFAIEVYTR